MSPTKRVTPLVEPSPPTPLKDHCSVIHNNTLYTFQSNAFQSLSLQPGAQWQQLPMGVPVSGARCIIAPRDGQDTIFVLGGTATTDATFPGFQMYSFAGNKWQSEQPQLSILQNRMQHGIAYLAATGSIVVYGGYQDNSFRSSSQTFTISTRAPYTTQSYPGSAPPVLSPLMMSWNSTHAVMMGGNNQNKAIWVFSEASGWQALTTTLPNPLLDMTQMQGSLIQGQAGSKALQLFNLAAVPNEVTTLVVQQPTGQPPIGNAAAIADVAHVFAKRDVDLNNLPKYNNSLAPTVGRVGFSLATDGNGLAVISGGTADTSNPLTIFNQAQNGWVDTLAFFSESSSGGGPQVGIVQTSSAAPTATLSSAPSGTVSVAASSATDATNSPTSTLSSAVASASSAAAAAATTPDNSKIILGSVLGGVFGLAAILIVLFLCLKWRRSKKHSRKGGYVEEKPDPRADSALGMVPFSDYDNKSPLPKSKTMATMRSTTAQVGSPSKRGILQQAGDSNGSQISLAPRREGPTISNPVLIPQPEIHTPAPMHTRSDRFPSPTPVAKPNGRADEGWSRYFSSNDSATGLATRPVQPFNPLSNSDSRLTTHTMGVASEYTLDSSIAESAEVRPLTVHSQAGGALNQENSWATTAFTGTEPPPKHPGRSVRASIIMEELAREEHDGSYLSETSSHQTWDALGGGASWNKRPASSVYTDSVYYPHPGEKVRISRMPSSHAGGKSNRVSEDSSIMGRSDSRKFPDTGMRTTAAKGFAGLASLEERELPEVGVRRVVTPKLGSASSQGGSKPVARGAGDASGIRKDSATVPIGAAYGEDMSWLELNK